MDEEWRPIPGYEGCYEASTLGRIRNCRIKRFGPKGDALKPQMAGRLKYQIVNLCAHGKSRVHLIHRLIAATFLGNCPPDREVNHRNGDRLDNRLANLEYVTRRENFDHAMRTGLTMRGGANPLAKLTEEDVAVIRASGDTHKTLAKRFGVTNSAIHCAQSGKTWGHVGEPRLHAGIRSGMRHHFAKLNSDIVLQIRSSSENDCVWAERLRVDAETIRCARIGRTWKQVGGDFAKARTGENHPFAKLTEDDVRTIRSSSASCLQLSKQFGVNSSVIVRIRQRKSWKHVE